MNSRRLPSLLLAAALHSAITCAAAAQQVQLAPQDGVLLLRNGEVLQGKITLAGDRYYVVLPAGEIFPKVSDVEMFCRDMHEAYLRKRASVRPDRMEDRLTLADWCIRHRLYDQALAELQQAAAADPAHAMIPLLQRRLELAKNPPPVPAVSRATNMSHHDLDQLIRGLPPGNVETFTNSIQPLLLNHCATAGCHGPQSDTAWQLVRVPLGKSTTRRVTQRNIANTLELINRNSPSTSPLLTVPLEQHGTTRGPIFSSRELAQYKLLVDWVHQAAGGAKAAPSSVEHDSPALLQTIQPTEPAAEKHDAKAETGSTPANLKLRDAQSPQSASNAKADGPVYVPVDPFDPEVFNRQARKPK